MFACDNIINAMQSCQFVCLSLFHVGIGIVESGNIKFGKYCIVGCHFLPP